MMLQRTPLALIFRPAMCLVGLLLGGAIPMRLKGLRACIDLMQHDRVGFVVRNEYVEPQGTGLGRKATLGVSLQRARHEIEHDWLAQDSRTLLRRGGVSNVVGIVRRGLRVR